MKACVGCGFCCLKATCVLGVAKYRVQGRCPGLKWDGQRYRCALAGDYAEELYIGVGCCAALNTWRQDVRNRDPEKRLDGIMTPWHNPSVVGKRKESAMKKASFKVHLGYTAKGNDRWARFATVDEAVAFCEREFRKSGRVLSVTLALSR